MSALPTGTVTFLFTDIEASTRPHEAQPEAYRFALARREQEVAILIAQGMSPRWDIARGGIYTRRR